MTLTPITSAQAYLESIAGMILGKGTDCYRCCRYIVSKRAYQLQNIEKQQVVVTGSQNNSVSRSNQPTVISTISDLFALVKQEDKDFQPNPVNKALLNDNGTPMILYHQTENDFMVFDVKHKGSGSSDYAQELLENPNNIELEIKRRPLKESATGEKHPNTFNELSSNNSIPNSTEDINDSTKNRCFKHLCFYITRNYFRLAIVAGN